MKFIYCLIFMAAAVLAVSAQEVILAIAPADNGSLNLTANETANATLNQTLNATLNAAVPAAESETVLAAVLASAAGDATVQENATTNVTVAEDATAAESAAAVRVEPAAVKPASTESGFMHIGSAQKPVYTIGGSQISPSQFSIRGETLPQDAYEVGLPAESIQELSNLPFFINKFWS